MEYIQRYFLSFWEMTVLMHGFILFGLLVAGVMREFISDDYIRKNLGGSGLMPSIKATVLGLPLPLCSCSVIPLAASLRKSGAGRGAVTSFFISTPMTGADSVIATYGVFGWFVALLRVISAGSAAIFAGFFIDKSTDEKADFQMQQGSSCSSGCCSSSAPVKEKVSILGRLKNIFNYAFLDLLDDLAFPLITGLLMAALITLFITPEIASSTGGIVAGYLFAFAVGVPLYVCSISAIPVALSLMVAGFSPGAAFVFLAAAPATNMVTLSVFGKLMGRRGLLIYIASIVFFTLLTAIGVDYLYLNGGLELSQFHHHEESATTLSKATAAMFIVVTSLMAIRSKIRK